MSESWATHLRRVHAPVHVPDVEWAALQAEAEVKNERSKQAAWTREWNPDYNLVGLVGEWLYAHHSGLTRKHGFGDGGTDFGRIDVKASTRPDNPLLLRLAADPLVADYFALVAVDVPGHVATYVGYATRSELAAAPHKEYGRGPTRTLRADQLHKGLVIESPWRSENPLDEVLFYAEKGRLARLA